MARAVDRVALAVASVFLIGIFIVEALGVFFRYVLQHSLPWADETAAYLFIWLIFLGAAAEVWSNGHPRITFLVDRLPRTARRVSAIVANAAVAIWGGVLLIYGLQAVALERPETWSSVPSLSLQLPYSAIPTAGAIVILFAVAKALQHE